MSQSPTRTPRFLSTVPAQAEITPARFGQKSPPQIRPLLPETKDGRSLAPRTGAETAQVAAAKAAYGGNAAPGAPALPPPAPTPEEQTALLTLQLEAAAAEMDAQRRESRERLANAIEGLRLQGEKLAEQARADALEIAFAIARKIVEVELRSSPEPLFALVRQSLQQLGAARRITLHVSPHDLEALRSPRGQDAMGGSTLVQIELFGDTSLETGECLIESDLGQIDGRLANRFSELRRTVDAASEGAA